MEFVDGKMFEIGASDEIGDGVMGKFLIISRPRWLIVGKCMRSRNERCIDDERVLQSHKVSRWVQSDMVP